MKYKVGDMVEIVIAPPRVPQWNHKMNCWLGGVMTIRDVEGDHYKMEEDILETDCNYTPGWNWYESMIEGLAPTTDELCDFEEDDGTILDGFISSYAVK